MKVLYTKDGEVFPVTGETERYWLCEETQFKKSNPGIVVTEKKQTKKQKKED